MESLCLFLSLYVLRAFPIQVRCDTGAVLAVILGYIMKPGLSGNAVGNINHVVFVFVHKSLRTR
jgi:hypothetical protein